MGNRVSDVSSIQSILPLVGVEPNQVTDATLIQRKGHRALYRITKDGISRVLKWCDNSAGSTEAKTYQLLQEKGVPTLPVYGWSTQAVLLEDLQHSPVWRLAIAEDTEREDVGIAVAHWYRALHAAGYRICADPAGKPSWLAREVDALTPRSVLAIGEKLGSAENPVWQFAPRHILQLVHAFTAFPATLNYNDFHWTNLALTRQAPLRAVVFDYHLLGIGPVYCDIRNVSGSLGAPARTAFQRAYGPVDDRVAILDKPLSILYALQVAIQQPQLPAWAKGCVEQVNSGELFRLICEALVSLDDGRHNK